MGVSPKTAYDTRGFWMEPAVLPMADIETMRAEGDRIWSSLDLSRDYDWVHWRGHEEEGRVADRLDPARLHSDVFADMCERPQLTELAEEILGGPVFVMKDKLIMKRPGTDGYGVHQDQAYWEGAGLEADETVTAAIALDDVTPAHGPIELYRGLHGERMPADPNDPLDVDPAALEGLIPDVMTMQAGDVVFFHAMTPHSSGPNVADTSRRLYLVTYALDKGNAQSVLASYTDYVVDSHRVHRR